jgi:four helix bundle protein
MFNFEKLDAWQVAIEFADMIYAATRSFPADERFGLTNQMRRATVSVAANLAEGNGRSSPKDQLRFIEIAYGSLLEVVSHAVIAKRQQMLTDDSYQNVYRAADRLGRMLSGLRASLQQTLNPHP